MADLIRRTDFQAPSIPTGLSANAVSSAQIELAWSASTDNVGVKGYRVRRNGTLLAIVGNVTTYEDIGLTAATKYSYSVRAYDAAGNLSGISTAASATTQAIDTTPPAVSSTSPANAAIDIAANSAVTATFSEVMLKATLNAGTFQLTQGGLPVAGTVTATSNSATFTPSVPLAALAQHTATITTGVEDSAGNPLAADFTWSFTTGPVPDTTPPTVSSISPADAATGVALNSSVSATFSEAMTNATLTNTTFALTQTSGGAIIGGRVSISGNTATFAPSVALAGDTNYTATITTGVQDAAGNALAANLAWTFTTAAAPDTTPPTVSAMSPASGAAGVALNSSVSATFSEPMTNSTLTNASFTLADSGGAAVSGMVTVSGNTATFMPSAPLAALTQHTATISTAAKDAAGNALGANFSSTFTTAAAPDTTPPAVSATSPANGATGVALNSPVSAAFSEAMANATLNTASFTVAALPGGATVAGTVNVGGNTATFTPSASLAAGTQYAATISTAAADAAGNALATGVTWFFTTAAPAPPVPTVSLSANPTSVASGGSPTLSWSSTNAASCSASGAWSGAKGTSGSEVSGALTSPGTFTLACTGAGGTASASATVTLAGAPPTPSYATTFDLTENAISEGGAWRRAANAWTNVRTANGIAFGTNGAKDTYDDSYALLSGFGPNQQAEAVVFRSPTLVSNAISHEMELLLRFSDDAGNARGYECLFNYAGGVEIVRWNGPLGSFTSLPFAGGTGKFTRDLATGDVIKATIVGNVIRAFVNGVLIFQASDSAITSGQPGIAFFTRPDGVSASADFGMTSYKASGL